MSALLLHPVEARHVPFSHIPLGGLFAFQGRFYTRISGADGRPVARRNREPATRLFVGAMVQEVHALDADHFFITEFLERGPEGTTANRMPIAEWPAWSADLQRELFPVEPRPTIHHDRSKWAGFGSSVARFLKALLGFGLALLAAPSVLRSNARRSVPSSRPSMTGSATSARPGTRTGARRTRVQSAEPRARTSTSTGGTSHEPDRRRRPHQGIGRPGSPNQGPPAEAGRHRQDVPERTD